MKRNISKKTGYIVGNKKYSGKTCILLLETKEKVSLQEKSLETKGELRSQNKQANIIIKSTYR